MDWTPEQVTQQQLHEYRAAAETAWSDRTRHHGYAGDPQPSRGQCWVTSKWLTSLLGGDVGRKDGHYFWVSPTNSHVIDLTGDNYSYGPEDLSHEGAKADAHDDGIHYEPHQLTYRPGPVAFVTADHPLYRGYEVIEEPEDAMARRFRKDADAALKGGRKVADLVGTDPYPGESPQAQQDLAQSVRMEMPLHAEPGAEPETAEYNFVYANGQLHVAPEDMHSHHELMWHAGIPDHVESMPLASGQVLVKEGQATWQVQGNISLRGFYRILKDYTENVGWRWGGMPSFDGEPIDDDFAPRRAMKFGWKDGHLYLGTTSTKWSKLGAPDWQDAGYLVIQGSQAWMRPDQVGADPDLVQAIEEYVSDQGLKLAYSPLPGEGRMDERMTKPETGETNDLGSLNAPNQEARPFFPSPPDERQPGGVYKCPYDGEIFASFYLYDRHLDMKHRADLGDPDGGFPELHPEAVDPPREHENVSTLPVSSHRVARRVPGFKLYASLWDFDDDDHRHFVAFQNGSPVGYAVVDTAYEEPRVTMVQSAFPGRHIGQHLMARLQWHYPVLVSHAASPAGEHLLKKTGFARDEDGLYRWSAVPQQELPPFPFIYDIEGDTIATGQPGQRASDIPGRFSPSGIQEGTYENGKIVLRNLTNMTVTVRHLLDLWQWTHPLYPVKSVEQEDDAGHRQKLAEVDDAAKGRQVAILARTDPAADLAIDALASAGGHPYVVGGAVRDTFLGKPFNDVDLMVTNLTPDAVDQVLSQLPGRVDLTGKKFGVFRFKHRGYEVEVALPRKDVSTGDLHKDFETTVNPELPIEDDLTRRDFTVNSVAVDALTGKVVDPHGGIADIQAGKLRTTHPNSFREDPTRVLRALTAHAKHGFEPDERTRAEMREHAHRIKLEAPEASQAELDKILKTDDPAAAIELAHDTGVLEHFLPELERQAGFHQLNRHHDLPLLEHSLRVTRHVQERSDDPDKRLLALLHDIGKLDTQTIDPNGEAHYPEHDRVGSEMARALMNRLPGFSNERIHYVASGIQHHMYPTFDTPRGARRFLNRVGPLADDLMDLREADFSGKRAGIDPVDAANLARERELVAQVRESQEAVTQKDLAINGNDLINLGLPPGPQFGTILQTLTNEVIEDPEKNQRPYLLERARELA